MNSTVITTNVVHARSLCLPLQEAEEVHVQRRRTEIVAMHAEPLKRCLMQQLMPVLAKAMVDATDQQAADPVQFIAQKLLEVSSAASLDDH